MSKEKFTNEKFAKEKPGRNSFVRKENALSGSVNHSPSHAVKRFFLIGYPIAHSLSPSIYNAFFKEHKINAEYALYEIKEAEFEQKMRALLSTEGICGFNVTQPYKKRIIKFLDGLSGDAAFLQSVNCVSRENGKFIGYNTDRAGFEKTLYAFKARIFGKDALVLGAGGVAPAVVKGLLNAGVKRVFVYNRTFQRAVRLAELFKSTLDESVQPILQESLFEIAKSSAIIVNATTVGLNGEKSIVPERAIFSGQILYDLIYNPEETDFLRIGKKEGATVINGLSMLKAQGKENLKIWGLKGEKND